MTWQNPNSWAVLLIVTGTQGEDRAHPAHVTAPAAKQAPHR